MNTDLIKRLDIYRFSNILIFDKPTEVRDFDGLVFDTMGGKAPYDFIFSFVFSRGDMLSSIGEVFAKQLIARGGMLYMAYPKAKFDFAPAIGKCYKNTSFKAMDSFELAPCYSVVGFCNSPAGLK